MKLNRMFETLRNCRKDRKKYCIVKKVEFYVDDVGYMFALLPTIICKPWPHRSEYEYVVEILWLNMSIGIGSWRKKKHD